MPTKKKAKDVGFFASVPKSIASPEFYASIPKRSFGRALWYLFAFTFLATLVYAVLLVGAGVTHKDDIHEGIEKFAELYPQELVITFEEGEASINLPEPLLLPIPQGDDFTEALGSDLENVIVIDTVTPFSADQFKDYKVLAWLGKDSLYIKDSENVTVIDLSEVPNVVIDKSMVDEKTGEAFSLLAPILIGFSVASFVVVYLAIMMWRLFYLIFFALFLLIVKEIVGVQLSYGEAYKMGMYAITASVVVQMVVRITSFWTDFNGFIFLFTLVGLVTAGINMFKAKKAKLMK